MTGILMASVGNSYGSAPVNTVAPVVSGTATVGQTLSTTNGTWTGAPAPTFTYQWQRTGVDIGGATSSTYVLVAADYANTIRCVVRATNSVAPAGVTANSNSTASVAGNAPVNTVAPVVSGTATFGQTLSTTNGTWTGVPTPTFTYQWQRVTTNISGATSSTYVLVAADVGNTIRCVVTATNAVSAVSANSNSTATVAATVPGAPTIGTATATSASTATVAYTAPASNGGATITLYTATASPGGLTGTLATAGSGTITVSGLDASTSYTFTVKATNSVGQSAASAASNSITTSAAHWVVFTGNGQTTNNPIYSNDIQFNSGNSIGYNVTPSGYSMININNFEGTFAVLNPSGARVNGFVTSPQTNPTPRTVLAVGNSQANANYAVIIGSSGRAVLWDAASSSIGTAIAPPTSFFNSTMSSVLTSSNQFVLSYSGYDNKSGNSTLTFARFGTSNLQNTDFVDTTGRWDTNYQTVGLRTDGTGVAVSRTGDVWIMNSSFSAVTNSTRVASTGVNNGPVRAVCVDSNNNIYYTGDSGFSATGRVVKVNSGLTVATNFIFSSGDFAKGGMATYGNYLYGMQSEGGDSYTINAFNLTTLTLDWQKRFQIIGGSTVYAAGKQHTLYANSTGIYFGLFANTAAAGFGTYSFKIPLNGAVTNGTYAISGATSVTVADRSQTVTSASLALTSPATPGTNTSSSGTVATPTFVASGSVLPTATRTLFT